MYTGFNCTEAAVIKGCRSDLWINVRRVCMDRPTAPEQPASSATSWWERPGGYD